MVHNQTESICNSNLKTWGTIRPSGQKPRNPVVRKKFQYIRKEDTRINCNKIVINEVWHSKILLKIKYLKTFFFVKNIKIIPY